MAEKDKQILMDTVEGYEVKFDPETHRVVLFDGDEYVDSRDTRVLEDPLIKLARALAKRNFTRKPIMHVYAGLRKITHGNITSLSFDTKEVWINVGGHRQRLDLKYSREYYEGTEHNINLGVQIQQKLDQISKIEAEAKDLVQKLEKPINLEWLEAERKNIQSAGSSAGGKRGQESEKR